MLMATSLLQLRPHARWASERRTDVLEMEPRGAAALVHEFHHGARIKGAIDALNLRGQRRQIVCPGVEQMPRFS